MPTRIATQIAASARLLTAMATDQELAQTLAAAADACVRSLRNGGKVLLAGNGGSAADAQHVAAELVGRFAYDRPGLPAIALSTDPSIVTALGNDYGFEQLFARQVQALGKPGDILLVYSTSGTSLNIVRALETAKGQNLVTCGLTGTKGQKGPMAALCDYLLAVPTTATPQVQEGHLVLEHILCGLIEEAIFPRPA